MNNIKSAWLTAAFVSIGSICAVSNAADSPVLIAQATTTPTSKPKAADASTREASDADSAVDHKHGDDVDEAKMAKEMQELGKRMEEHGMNMEKMGRQMRERGMRMHQQGMGMGKSGASKKMNMKKMDDDMDMMEQQMDKSDKDMGKMEMNMDDMDKDMGMEQGDM